MAVVQIGRVGSDIEISEMSKVRVASRQGSHQVTVTIQLVGTTVTQRMALQTELDNQVGQVIPFLFSHNNSWDGFYVMESANVEIDDYGLNTDGLHDATVNLTMLGRESKVRFQIMSASQVLANDHSILVGSVLFHTAGPVGAYAVDASGLNLINTHSRSTEDGVIQAYIDIDQTPIRKPSWAVGPANYYKGGCKLYVGGILDISGAIQTTGGIVRTGPNVPMLPADWMLTNGLIRIVPGVTAGRNDGRVGIAAWSGGVGWDPPQYFRFTYDPAGTPGVNDEWHSLTVIHYSTEKTILRLERDADEFSPTTHMHRLDIHLRRGDPFFSGYYFYSGGNAPMWGLGVVPTAAATDVTPTAGPVTGLVATTAVNGNKWFMATPMTNTQDNANGELRWATTDKFRFGLGYDIDTATNVALDQFNSLTLQYLARTEEKERTVRR